MLGSTSTSAGSDPANPLASKVVVVTGAASGIGRAASIRAAAAGASLVLVDSDGDRLGTLLGELDGALGIVADVADVLTASRYVDAAMSEHGRLDAALLNAGMAGTVGPIDTVRPDDFDRVMAVNVRSVWSGLAALFPVMKAAGGSIVVTASTGGLTGAPMVAPYIASKHAVVGLVRAAALEGARYGIRVNAVAPAPVDTPMMQHINEGLGAGDVEKSRRRTIAHVPLQRYASADEIARTILFLAGSDAAYTTGTVYPIDGGMTAGLYP